MWSEQTPNMDSDPDNYWLCVYEDGGGGVQLAGVDKGRDSFISESLSSN